MRKLASEMTDSEWSEQVATFLVHPDSARRDDVARMADEIMELRCRLRLLHATAPVTRPYRDSLRGTLTKGTR